MASSDRQWTARPVVAFAIHAAVVAVPVAASVATGLIVSRILPRQQGTGGTALWWATLFVVSTIVVFGAERVARRALPLAALYRLSLAFPGRAPSRTRVARRSAKTDVQADVAKAWREGLGDDPQRAAETILGLVAALSTHDRRTRGHSERVRMFTDMIAAEMALPESDRNLLRWAALLHDIGKLRVKTATLNKPGALDDDEWSEIKRHPEDGVALLAPLESWFGSWIGAILDHHERFDGSGYPNGVAGEEISLGARIVAVADAYDTMTASRPYRRALSPADGRRELAVCAGSHFDPAVVRAFMNVSIRRLRWAIGPMSWLTQFPLVSRTLEVMSAKAAGTALSLGSLGTLAGMGILAQPALAEAPRPAAAAPAQAALAPIAVRSLPQRMPTPKPDPQPSGVTPSNDPLPSPEPTPAPTPSPAPAARTAYLASSGAGDVLWSAPLPFASAAPATGPLANYASDHDADPGLTIERASNGLDETDPRRYQTWSMPGGFRLAGPVSVSFWSMLQNQEAGRRGTVALALLDCDATAACTTVKTTIVDASAWTPGKTWTLRNAAFGSTSAVIPAGHTLVLHVTVPETASDAIMFAYGTADYPSALTLKTAPL